MVSDTLRRQVGQHFVLGFDGLEVTADIRMLIQQHHLGSVILMKRNVQDATQVRKLIFDLQILAKEAGHEQPLLIGTDQENGLVSAFSKADALSQFPGAMALGATGDPELAERVYAASAAQLRLLGVHWAYGPVADVNLDARNPVIGVRSFGDDPKNVGAFVAAAGRGMSASRIASCAKHFPGHGDTHVDSHFALPVISKSREEMEKAELLPFRNYCDVGELTTVMTGHMALPALTGSAEEPASLSKKITTDLLRGELGFEGVVVTDCLEMDAIANSCGIPSGSVRALEAGADINMICHTLAQQVESIEFVCSAVESGKLSLERSAQRIRALKASLLGSWNDILAEHNASNWNAKWEKANVDGERVAAEGYAKSVALVQEAGPGIKFPIDVGSTILYTPQPESLNRAVDDAEGVQRGKNGTVRNTATASFLSLYNALSQRAPTEHVVYWKNETEQASLAGKAIKNLVFVLRNANTSVWQLEVLNKVSKEAEASGVNVVLLSCCTPYDLMDATEPITSYPCLATFEFTPPAFEAAVSVMFGDILPRGRVPVALK
ncbi:glycoside hydrolase family 3 protein [Cylindrobasidium torrendii FP15055 ss-10]|uniref:Glycoside hydrolase family 3 protein n=1 Tax=Cylindrobasidium torrendii FP15055 ss-10 TaxID=1314674 RepID=A0A0D7BB54_9AGAR|nr:glycoside hydrolase family 3 protein [Cylindrobasidium torrendii FP15055 ss-10]